MSVNNVLDCDEILFIMTFVLAYYTSVDVSRQDVFMWRNSEVNLRSSVPIPCRKCSFLANI